MDGYDWSDPFKPQVQVTEMPSIKFKQEDSSLQRSFRERANSLIVQLASSAGLPQRALDDLDRAVRNTGISNLVDLLVGSVLDCTQSEKLHVLQRVDIQSRIQYVLSLLDSKVVLLNCLLNTALLYDR